MITNKNRIIALIIVILGANSFPAVIEKDTSYTVFQTFQKLKKKYPEIRPSQTISHQSLQSNEEVVYKTITTGNGTRSLHLDCYRPADKKVYPALIMIHGGGWRSGDKKLERPLAQALALQGYVTIPVEYRLSTEALYPAALHDIKTAVCWIKAHAGKLGIDTTRMAIEGNSAGGQLAALVALSGNRMMPEIEKEFGVSSSLQAIVDIDGVVDFLSPQSLNLVRKPDAADVAWLGGTFDQKPTVWKEASPIFWVNEKSAPILFVCSAQPRFHAGRDELIDLYNQYHIYSELHTLPDSPHSFWLFEPWFTPTFDVIHQFLDKTFNKK